MDNNTTVLHQRRFSFSFLTIVLINVEEKAHFLIEYISSLSNLTDLKKNRSINQGYYDGELKFGYDEEMLCVSRNVCFSFLLSFVCSNIVRYLIVFKRSSKRNITDKIYDSVTVIEQLSDSERCPTNGIKRRGGGNP